MDANETKMLLARILFGFYTKNIKSKRGLLDCVNVHRAYRLHSSFFYHIRHQAPLWNSFLSSEPCQ